MIYLLIPAYNVAARHVRARNRFVRALRLRVVPAGWRPVLLFSGLRGALSLALVLSLPATLPQRALLETIVYGVVLVTLVGQGIGLRIVLPVWSARKAPASAAAGG